MNKSFMQAAISLASFLFFPGVLLSSHAQKALSIGDKIPPLQSSKAWRYKSDSLNLQDDFKGKPVILDFWHTTCGSCIYGMPRLDSLQRQFGDSITILLVTYEDNDNVEALFNRFRHLKNLHLPSIVSDKQLNKLFDHSTNPQEVWIDGNGEVKAITTAEEVNVSNIRKFIGGQLTGLPVKQDQMDNKVYMADYTLAAIDEKFNNLSHVSSYIFHGGYLPQTACLVSFLRYYPEKAYSRMTICNLSPLICFETAYRQEKFPGSVIYDRVDKELLDPSDHTGKLDSLNATSYDVIVRGNTTEEKINQFIVEDLDRWFSVKSSLSKRPFSSYVLSRIDPKKGIPEIPLSDSEAMEDDNFRLILGMPWERTFNMSIKNLHMAKPVVDETGISPSSVIGRMLIPKNWSDVRTINDLLKRYNLRVTVADRMHKVLVFTPAP